MILVEDASDLMKLRVIIQLLHIKMIGLCVQDKHSALSQLMEDTKQKPGARILIFLFKMQGWSDHLHHLPPDQPIFLLIFTILDLIHY